MNNALRPEDLCKIAKKIRTHIITMSTQGGCFIGASFSLVEIITALYFKVLNFSPENIDHPDRDYVILSKGHAVPTMYGAFVEMGLLSPQQLLTHQQMGSNIFWHPSLKIPGVEVGTGSLGHGLPVGVGIAKAIDLDKGTNKVFVICGDGELQEGTIWESALIASAFALENLCVIVDRNKIQANIQTEKLIPLESLHAKWEAFGWSVVEVDGHDFTEILQALQQIPMVSKKPTVVIAHTIRGKGVSFLENKVDKWFAQLTQQEQKMALEELGV